VWLSVESSSGVSAEGATRVTRGQMKLSDGGGRSGAGEWGGINGEMLSSIRRRCRES
jgi:hypothetical protein